MWNFESFNLKSFLGLTVHYLFDDEYKSVTIGVKELDERQTSNNIKVWLISMLDEWGIELVTKSRHAPCERPEPKQWA